MIRIRNLAFRYGESFQLQVPALDVAAHEKVALVGRSGCGKTTLLNLISGVQSADQGEISVAGTRIDTMPDVARRRFRGRQIGFVFQEFELIEYLTVRENILLPFGVQPGVRKPDDLAARLKQLLDATSLVDRASHFPRQLSQGQRQRTAVCRALITQPSLILADEPTGSLDSQSAREVIDLLFEQVQRISATLVMVTHDPQWLDRFDRVLSLDERGIES